MEDQEFWTKANRTTVVTRTEVLELPEGNSSWPEPEHLTHPSEAELRLAIAKGDTIWVLKVFYQTAQYEENCSREYFLSREAGILAGKAYTPGQEYDPFQYLNPSANGFDPDELSFATMVLKTGIGGKEAPYFLIYEALEGAGVYNQKWTLSELVITWLGERGEASIREKFGENWEAVAAFEYCNKHFHSTSLATLAARVLVGEFVANNSFDAGYASRELELLHGGVEDIAIRTMQTRKRAGVGGGKASSKKRLENLEIVIEEIEKLAGIVGQISEDRIVEQAFEIAKGRKPHFPKSRKTIEEYGTALRSQEPFKSRYEAVFRKNA